MYDRVSKTEKIRPKRFPASLKILYFCTFLKNVLICFLRIHFPSRWVHFVSKNVLILGENRKSDIKGQASLYSNVNIVGHETLLPSSRSQRRPYSYSQV